MPPKQGFLIFNFKDVLKINIKKQELPQRVDKSRYQRKAISYNWPLECQCFDREKQAWSW